jgi:hypothetical protein
MFCSLPAPARIMPGLPEPHRFGKVAAFKWTKRALVINTDLEPAVIAFNDERR